MFLPYPILALEFTSEHFLPVWFSFASFNDEITIQYISDMYYYLYIKSQLFMISLIFVAI